MEVFVHHIRCSKANRALASCTGEFSDATAAICILLEDNRDSEENNEFPIGIFLVSVIFGYIKRGLLFHFLLIFGSYRKECLKICKCLQPFLTCPSVPSSLLYRLLGERRKQRISSLSV